MAKQMVKKLILIKVLLEDVARFIDDFEKLFGKN
jgi:hypothetical protein